MKHKSLINGKLVQLNEVFQSLEIIIKKNRSSELVCRNILHFSKKNMYMLRWATHPTEVSWVTNTCFRVEPRTSWLTLRAERRMSLSFVDPEWKKGEKIILFLLRRVMWIKDKYPSGYIMYIFGDISVLCSLLFARLGTATFCSEMN